MTAPENFLPEELLANLVHDLRQPLGNIEASVYLLNMVTPLSETGTHAQLRAIERQTNNAARILTEVSDALARLRLQRVEAAGNFDLTNPATAAVT